MDFSIIIPAKNEAANIGRCLDSIRQSDYDPDCYEIIMVDNGSTDQTVALAQERGARVFIKPELTISGLRNFGASQASGRIFAFLDADCTVPPAWLEKASAYLDRTDIACYGSPPVVPDDATWVQRSWFPVRKKKTERGETDWLESMNMFVRKEAFNAVGGFDETLITCEDYDLSMRLRQHGLLICDSSIVAVHHGEAATVSHFFRKELWRGKSNFAGVMQHGVTRAELPSLLTPSLHCLLWLACLISIPIVSNAMVTLILLILLIWESLLFFVSLRKWLAGATSIISLFQLFFLLHIYLFARGISIFSSGFRSTEAVTCAA